MLRLSRFKDLPDDIQQSYAVSGYKPKFMYRIVKGWRKPHRYEFLTIPVTFDPLNSQDDYKRIVAEKGKSTVLLFVKNPEATFGTQIIGSVNLDHYKVDLTFLKHHDWEWAHRTLID